MLCEKRKHDEKFKGSDFDLKFKTIVRGSKSDEKWKLEKALQAKGSEHAKAQRCRTAERG